MAHTWTEYPDGGAKCPACGAIRDPMGQVWETEYSGLCEPIPPRREIDGVIVDGPPS